MKQTKPSYNKGLRPKKGGSQFRGGKIQEKNPSKKGGVCKKRFERGGMIKD